MDDNQLRQLMDEGAKISKRLQDEIRSATRVWCIVEAFNGRDEDHRFQQHERIEKLGLGQTAVALIKGLTRDTLSSLLRVSDPPGKLGNRQTFCALIDILEREEVVATLSESARNWQPDCGKELAERNADLVADNVKFIRKLVTSDWKKPLPNDQRLLQFRAHLRPVRNSILAHAADYNQVDQPTFNQIRSFLKLASEIQSACSLVFLGSADDLQRRWEVYLQEANEFWDHLSF